MNHDEHPDDSTLTQELRDSLSDLAVPERPPLAAITSRGRVHQRRRLAGFAGLLQTGAAFTLTDYANGTVSLNLSQLFDPAALQRALAQHGIPALVKIGTYCSSSPAAPDPGRDGVLSPPGRAGTLHGSTARGGGFTEGGNFPVKPSQLAPMFDPVTMVINPAAMPSGTELFIGYYNLGHTLYFDLIYTSSHTCRNTQQPPATP